MAQNIETRRKRLLYQASYRGFKEADLLIGGFARAHLGAMPEAELDEFEALLEHSDHDLYNWAKGDVKPPPEIDGPLLEKLKQFNIADRG